MRYLPRAFEMAKSWEMVKRDEMELKALEDSLAKEAKGPKMGVFNVSNRPSKGNKREEGRNKREEA